jgi:hypothetical protein
VGIPSGDDPAKQPDCVYRGEHNPMKSISFKFAGGQCPNQAWGWVDGKWFYFRGRWGAWTLEVGDAPDEFELPKNVETYLDGVDVIDGNEPGWWSLDKIEPFVRNLLEKL